jgi:DNA polymerase-3 subunit delta
MIHLLLGANEYLSAEWLAARKAALGDPEMASLNTVELTGAQTNAAKILGEAAMMPFLAPQRLVVVHGLLDHYEKRMASSKSTDAAVYAEMAQFLDGIRSVPESCILVLVDNSVDKRRGLWKGYVLPAAGDRPERRVEGVDALIKAGVLHLETLTAPDVKELPGWLQRRARQRNIAIEGNAVALLCNFVGPNLRQLDNELEKLSLYAGNRPITQQDVRAMVADASEELIWNLTDALAQRQPAKSMHALRDLRRNDQNPIYIASMIARQYRMLIEIKSLATSGVTNQYDIAKQLGYAAYPVQKAMPLTHQYTFTELEEILDRLLEVDMAMKTGADQDTELDILVAELSVQRQKRAA